MPAIRGGPPAHTIAASGCVNAITGAVTEHHAVFTNYTALTLIDDHPLDLWHAIKHPLKLDPVSAAQAPETTHNPSAGFQRWLSMASRQRDRRLVVDWLGIRVPRSIYCHMSYYRQRWAHALRAQLCDLTLWAAETESYPLPLPLPYAGEEYFEYIDTLEAVLHYAQTGASRRRPFAMLEIGAGFGFWTVTAHAALRQLLGRSERPAPGTPVELSYDYTLIELDSTKHDGLRATLELNGIDESFVIDEGLAPARSPAPLIAC